MNKAWRGRLPAMPNQFMPKQWPEHVETFCEKEDGKTGIRLAVRFYLTLLLSSHFFHWA